MKLRLLSLAILFCTLVSGCSLLNEVNSSLDYVKEATAYINQVTAFSEQIPNMAQNALVDPQARQQLLDRLSAMKESITVFNNIDAPAFAKDIHAQLVSYNETFSQEINAYIEKINSNVIDLNSLADSQMLQTIDNIVQTLTRIQQLGQ